MAEASPPIPITPDIARELGKMRYGESFTTPTPMPELVATRKLWQDGKAEEALIELAKPKHVPHDKKDVEQSFSKRHSTERDADGKKVAPSSLDERRRTQEGIRKFDIYRKFLDTGVISAQHRNEVKSFLTRSSSAFQDAIQGKTTDAEINAIVDDFIIKDPIYRRELLKLYTARGDPKTVFEGEKDVQALELSLAKLEAKLKGEVTEAELQTAQTNLTTTETALVTAGVNVTEVAGYQTDFENLTGQINDARAKVKSLEISHGAIQGQIDVFQNQIDAGTLAGTLSVADTKTIFAMMNQLKVNPEYAGYRDAKATVDRYESAKAYLDLLNPGQKTALQEFSTAQTKLHDLKEKAGQSMKPQERADSEAQIKGMKIELADAKDILQAQMIEDYRNVTHMAEDAVQEYLSAEMKKLPELFRTATTEQKTKEQESLSSATEKIQKTWKDPRVRRGVMSLVTNRGRTSRWINAWMQQGDEGIRVQMNALTDPDLTGAGLTTEEITVFRDTLADPIKSKAFLTGNADVIGAQALADYFTSGGRFRRAEITAITSSEKGRELMKKAMASVDAQRAARNELSGKGVLGGIDNIIGGRPSGEKHHSGPGRIGLAVLLLIFGAAAFKGARG